MPKNIGYFIFGLMALGVGIFVIDSCRDSIHWLQAIGIIITIMGGIICFIGGVRILKSIWEDI